MSIELLFAVRCTTKIRSARIQGSVVMVDLGFDKLGFRMWTELPEDIFKLLADNKRHSRDQSRGDYTTKDGRAVCAHIIGRNARVRFIGRAWGDRVWREAEILSIL